MTTFDEFVQKIKQHEASLFERYEHHGVEVSVRTALKGKHRGHCLCFACDKFKGGGHCPIANELYAFCVKHNMTTPVYECPHFEATK